MFTGLVDDIGTIERIAVTPAGLEFRVGCRYGDLQPGESIALNGACLTVRECDGGWFTVAAVATTLERTTMGSWDVGTEVNLERAVRAGDRLGGHLVLGHVDDVWEVLAVARVETALLIDIGVTPDLARLLVPHGSVTVDGVSLTVNRLPSPSVVQVSVIEYTERHTTLGRLQPSGRVHLEADVIGKYVQALLRPGDTAPGGT